MDLLHVTLLPGSVRSDQEEEGVGKEGGREERGGKEGEGVGREGRWDGRMGKKRGKREEVRRESGGE